MVVTCSSGIRTETFHKMLRVAILLLGASMASALQHDIGPCNLHVTADPNFDFEMFSQESKGVWTFVKVPVTETNHNLVGMFQTSKSTGRPGEYHTTIYSKNQGEQKYKNVGDATVVDSSSGHLTATSRVVDGKNTVLQVAFLKYVPGRYAYFTVCSDEGDDSVVHRYVVAHSRLDPDEEAEVNRIERKYHFKGILRDI